MPAFRKPFTKIVIFLKWEKSGRATETRAGAALIRLYRTFPLVSKYDFNTIVSASRRQTEGNGILRPAGLDFVVAMANQKTFPTDGFSNESPGRGVIVKGKGIIPTNSLPIAVALTVALAAPLVTANRCDAADFSHAKKVVVPPSSIPRRYDYSSSSGREAGLPSGYEANYDGGNYASYPNSSSSASSSSSYSKSAGKSGLVPPPPPVTPSLLPSSLAGDVPPPPGAPSIVSRTSPYSGYPGISSSSQPNTPASPGSSTITSNGYQQTNADPIRSTSLNRHSTAQKVNKHGAESSAVSQITARADALVKEGKLAQAQDLLESYDKVYPKNAALNHKLSEVSLDRAKYYMRHDDYVEGAKQARTALAHNSNNTEAKQALEQILRHHGIEPQHSLSRVKIGDLLFSQGKLKEARVEYESALKVDHSSSAYIGLGNIALRENKLKEAKNHYQLALEKEPESSIALRQLGIVRYKLKDVVGANADLTRALVLNQDDKLAGQTLVELWQRQVSMHQKDANSHLGLARAHQLAGDLKSAQNSYRTVVSIDPNHPNLPAARQSFKLALARQEAQNHYDAAKTLDASGAITEAYAKSAQSVALSPGDMKFRLYQAELAERIGNYPEAKHLYLEVLRQDPNNLTAANKIKTLAALLAKSDATHALRGPLDEIGLRAQAGALPGIASNQGATPGSLHSLLGTPQAGNAEGPALKTLPGAPKTKGPSPDPVQNMSGFLGDLRGLMLKQKKDLSKQEDLILESIGAKPKSGGGGGGGDGAGGKLADLPALPDMPDLKKPLITSSDIQKILAGVGGAKAGAGTEAAAAAGAAALTAPSAAAGATSAQDIANLLGGGSTASGAAPQTAPPIAQSLGHSLSSSLPPMSSAAMDALRSGQIPAGLSSQALSSILGGGMSGMASSNPPLSTSGQSVAQADSSPSLPPGDSILSAPPRGSETVLKVADTPPSKDEFPPLAPPRQARYRLPPLDGAAPALAANELAGLAAQAQSLSPEALAGIAKSLGVDPAHVASMAEHAMKHAPHLIDQGISNINQEDIDKVAKVLKDHVAAKQTAIAGAAPKTDAVTKSIVTNTKATPQLVKKIETRSPAPATAKTISAQPVRKMAAKPGAAVMKPAQIAANPSTNKMAANGTKNTETPVMPEVVASTLPVDIPATASTAGSGAGQPPLLPAPETASAALPQHVERLSSLEAQNKELVSQLEDTRKQLQELKESLLNQSTQPGKPNSMKKLKAVKPARQKSVPKETMGTESGGALPRLQTLTPGGEKGEPPVSGQLRGPLNPLEAGKMPALPAPNQMEASFPVSNPIEPGALPVGPNVMANVPNAIPMFVPSQIVNLELAGINVRPKGVRLNVVLKNGTGANLEVPSNTKAVVRMVGLPDQIADVRFPVKSLTPGQEAKGYISVSGHKLDPSADVFIPKLMSTANGRRDVHLTVPISSLGGTPQ